MKERIEYLLSLIADNDKDIERIAGINYNTLKTIRSRGRIGIEGIRKLCEYFPTLNLKWLILEDEIERSPFQESSESEHGYAPPIIKSPQVGDTTIAYMKSSSLYNYPLLVDEVQSLRKTVEELRKSIAELMGKAAALESVTGQ